jgi:surface antigen
MAIGTKPLMDGPERDGRLKEASTSMNGATSIPRIRAFSCVALIVFAGTCPAEEGWGKKLFQAGACAAAGVGGAVVGEKIAEWEAKKNNLPPAEAKKRKRSYQIGFAIALCGGGAALAGTAYSAMSKRGQEAREKEINAALEDSNPHTYADPENPSVQGTVSAMPVFKDGERECRIAEDQYGGDQALIKYCRGSDGKWKVRTV